MYFAIFLDDKQGASLALSECKKVWGGLMITHIESIAKKHNISN